MKARSRILLDRSIAAMLGAIDVYNKPDFIYRGESFTILALNAWELLLKAKWLADNKNKLNSLYVYESNTGKKRPRYKKTRSGAAFTYGVDYLTKKFFEKKTLDKSVVNNLDALIELRNASVHFYHQNTNLAQSIQEIGMACVKNFIAVVKDWFDEDLSRFHLYIMPLAFDVLPARFESISLSKEEKGFLAYIRDLKPQNDDPGSRYSVMVSVELRFVRSKGPNVTEVHITKDPNAPQVQLTYDQVRDKYPLDFKELTDMCRKKYKGFKADNKYHSIRKPLLEDERFCHVRQLDPKSSKSPKKQFYNPAIFQELDKHYELKSN